MPSIDQWVKTTFEVTTEAPGPLNESDKAWAADELKFILDENYTRPVIVTVKEES